MFSDREQQVAVADSARVLARGDKRKFLLPGALLLMFAAQCLWFIGTQSFTGDEATNLAIGMQHWRGHPEVGADNPPLLRLLCSLPLLGTPAADAAATHFTSQQAFDPVAAAWRTRLPNVLLGLLLGYALWSAARRRFSVGAANFALALFAFSPPLIAHFSIVGTDGIAALMIFVTAVQVAAFRRDPSWRQALVTGVVLGLLLLAKLYALPIYALALLLLVLPSPMHWRLRQWPWGKALAMIVVSFVLLWACYWFRTADLVVRDRQVWLEHGGAAETLRYPVPVDVEFSLPLPAADFVHSIVAQSKHGYSGHKAYLLGKVSTHGWRYYFPVAIALKWPTLVLVLGVVTVLGLVPTSAKTGQMRSTIRSRLPADFGTTFLFPASFFAWAISSTVNIGERYVLAVYPFLLLFVAGLYPHLPKGVGHSPLGTPDSAPEPTNRGNPSGAEAPVEEETASARLKPCPSTETSEASSRWREEVQVAVLVLAAALNAVDALRCAPDYLSYFTVFIPQQQSWRYLSDSSTDWGQGLIALRQYEQQHPGEELHVAYFVNPIAPEHYGVQATPFGEKERPSGTVIVSPGVLSGQFNVEPEAYRWVLRYPVKAVLGHHLLVFEVRQ